MKNIMNQDVTIKDLKKMIAEPTSKEWFIKYASTEAEQAQYIEDNLSILEEYHLENEGWACNKDNVEDHFSNWLEGMEFADLVAIINK